MAVAENAQKVRKKKSVLLDIEPVLSSKRHTWSVEVEEKAEQDKALKKIRPTILKRDNFTCRSCGFRAAKYQEIHHINDDHTDNKAENLATICSFCHMSFHIGRAGLLGEAELIWLPEMDQKQLNHIARAIFVAMHHAGEMRSAAENLYSALRVRADDARRRLGTSDPADLGEALIALDEEDYVARKDKLEGIRLLPLGRRIHNDRDVFPDILDVWSSGAGGPFVNLQPETWMEILDSEV